jgi:hypothetical protein
MGAHGCDFLGHLSFPEMVLDDLGACMRACVRVQTRACVKPHPTCAQYSSSSPVAVLAHFPSDLRPIDLFTAGLTAERCSRASFA